jgi:hypothetical protein
MSRCVTDAIAISSEVDSGFFNKRFDDKTRLQLVTHAAALESRSLLIQFLSCVNEDVIREKRHIELVVVS